MAKLEKISDTSWKQLLKDRKSYRALTIPKDVESFCQIIDNSKGGQPRLLHIEFSENLQHSPFTGSFNISSGREVSFPSILWKWLESLTEQQRQDSFFIVTVLDAPALNLDRMPTADRVELEKTVEELLDDPNLPEPEGVEKPKTRTQNNVSSIERDAEVKAWVIQQANGKCEYCQETGFIKDNGKHYMEVHHLRPLAEHGSDKPRNTVAVCPNCHKKLHFAQCRKKIRTELIQRITRLKDEYL